MCIILKQKRLSRAGALKALDFATTRQPAACERLVDMGGLKSLFGALLENAFVMNTLHLP
jgi:beta-catenin-like protein 1